MKKFTKAMVDDYANKLLIGLTKEENKMVLDEFEIIDKNMDLVNKIEGLDSVEPMTYCLDDLCGEFREDIIEESINIEDLLSNSDDVEDKEIVVPRVVGGEE